MKEKGAWTAQEIYLSSTGTEKMRWLCSIFVYYKIQSQVTGKQGEIMESVSLWE